MKAKFLELLDNKVTWATFGMIAGTILGEKAALVVQGVGLAVMAAI